MASASSSSGAESGIQAPGGAITKGPGAVLFAILAIVALVWLMKRRKK